jgi:hypothetical protein
VSPGKPTRISPDNGEESSSGTSKLGHLGFAHVTKLGKVASLDRFALGFKSESDQSLPIVQLVILPDKK